MTERANSNIAVTQGGNALLIGGATEINPEELNYKDYLDTLRGGGSPANVGWWDDFFGDTLNATYAPDLSTGASASVSAAANGKVRLATSTTDENHATLALGLHWSVANGPLVMEARVANVSAATSRSVEVGWSDALSETAGEAFSSHDSTLVDVAVDAAVFAINAEETVTTWKAISVNDGGTPVGTASTKTATADEWDILRVEINVNGDASFYVNGDWLTTHESAVATTALLTPWITITTQTTGDRQLDVDYLLVSSKRV